MLECCKENEVIIYEKDFIGKVLYDVYIPSSRRDKDGYVHRGFMAAMINGLTINALVGLRDSYCLSLKLVVEHL